jgi:hypothetical protein
MNNADAADEKRAETRWTLVITPIIASFANFCAGHG